LWEFPQKNEAVRFKVPKTMSTLTDNLHRRDFGVDNPLYGKSNEKSLDMFREMKYTERRDEIMTPFTDNRRFSRRTVAIGSRYRVREAFES
jgi:tRNA nucleotidyltransferase/poly(A) polymerase